ncbi:MAG: ATP-dependent protease La substrate-binding domain [Pseudomonadota bacterium]|jgi:Lon protease-like protein
MNTVLFPGGPLPLRIFEPRYVDMVKDCLRRILLPGARGLAQDLDDAGWVSCRLAEIVPMDLQARQRLLEALEPLLARAENQS